MEWYYATSKKATFGFEVVDDRVIATAPYARRWLIGLRLDVALHALRRRGYVVTKGSP